MNKKLLAAGLMAVLAVSISIATLVYFQNQYTITGTLSYAPGHAVYLGISATSITPNVSPQPSNRTFSELAGPNGETEDFTVASFVLLKFSDENELNYPSGFEQGNIVKVTGQISREATPTGILGEEYVYVLHVSSITHYTP